MMWFSNDELEQSAGGVAAHSWLGGAASRLRSGLTPNMFDNEVGHHAAWTPSVFAHQPAALDDSTKSSFDYFSLAPFTGSGSPTTLRPDDNSNIGREQYALDGMHEFEPQQTTFDTDDVFATLDGRRKRAMSSPALLTPGGSLQHGLHSAFERGPFEMPLELKLMKRTRPSTGMTWSSSGSRTMSSVQSTSLSEESPASSASTVLTPPDTSIPPSAVGIDSFVNPFLKTDQDISAEAPQDTALPALSTTVSLTDLAGSATVGEAKEVLPAVPRMPGRQTAYEMFHMPAIHTELVAAQPFMYELEARQPYNVVLGPSTTRNVAGSDPKLADSPHTDDADLPDSDSRKDRTADRRASLERNRLAAVKSRRKKKERVQNLESAARVQATKNHALQNIALSLRQELTQIRQKLDAHDGCDCEHVVGYLARERAGGGIPTIDALAGRVFSIDYKNVPTLGSEDDCYQHHFTPTPEIAELLRKAGKPGAGGGARVKREPSASSDAVSPPRPGARTRRLTATNSSNLVMPLPSLPDLPETSTIAPGSDLIVRPSSAPPTTPSWEPATNSSESYFTAPAQA
ncbi:hypothetical protein OIV83_002283 [Microbotryomycetes sp. JL201]|nr:hypothetical protein OIV83_002283 [Microbotryomycetes sp. JL201]